MAKALLKADSFYEIYERKPGANKGVTHYCPGCGHGVLHKLIAEAIDDFDIQDRTIIISPVGCSVFAYYYFRTGNIQAAHGRAPAVATGIKRAHPNSIVISYQGDGDLAAIGGNNIIQAANRGEKITVFFVNNAIYGMTGGQMAPTTLVGQKTTTSPTGRDPMNEGFPMRMAELISSLQAPIYVERVALTDAKHTNKVRKAVRKALRNQIDDKGFSFVEVLSTCPSGWKVSPVQAKQWTEDKMFEIFPLGVFKDESDAIESSAPKKFVYQPNVLPSLGLDKNDPIATGAEAGRQRTSFKMAGFGGQGILLMGVGVAQAGMQAGYHVSWIPSYGPEMRGGTANCHVNLSPDRIGSPLVSQLDVLMAMNLPSLMRFESEVKKDGLIVYDVSLIDQEPLRKDVDILAVPATEIADELGNTRVANMVMLGAYLGYSRLMDKDILFQALPQVIRRKALIELNKQAIEKGFEYIAQTSA
jgi:2-oxoisovalerate ferredoxin oxidoreductase beta subunit